MILDLGSGGSEKYRRHKVRGDVNVDILKPTYKIPNFVLCDAHFLPFKDGLFDEVMMFDIVEHLNSPSEAIKEAYRVIQKKGKLQIGTPNALYLPKIIRASFSGTYSPYKDHIATWGLPELQNLLLRCGFSNSEIKCATYIDDPKWFVYDLLIKICPFQAIKHRQLFAVVTK